MKIINPLYDNAFKYLMDNEQIAKTVLSIILDKKIISLQSKPQETPIVGSGFPEHSRYDFKAIIQEEKGEQKNVLIELQKYKNPNPISRFREYLGENYIKEETFINSKGKETTEHLPIIAIYILGYKISKKEALVLKVENTLMDYIQQTPLEEKITEVELLTHPAIFLQTTAKPKPEEEKGTQLEKFIKLFVQKLKGDKKNFIIEVDDELRNDPEINKLVEYLNLATANKKVVRQLRRESEYEASVKTLEKDLMETKAREEEERRQKEEAEKQIEVQRRQKEEAEKKLASFMKKAGTPIEEIIKETGLTKEEIENL